MSAYLEVTGPEGARRVALEGDRVTVGAGPENAVVLEGRRIGRHHAVLEPRRGGWCIRDLGAYDGTLVNGKRIFRANVLRAGDEIRIANHTIVYGVEETVTGQTLTSVVAPAPKLTGAERTVLLALCRPVLLGDVFTEPATFEEIAEELSLTGAALRTRLQSLYEKFAIFDEGDRRRVLLANEAVRRGAVSPADLAG